MFITKSNRYFIIVVYFTFVSDHNTNTLMLCFVLLKNMYSYLNSSLELPDIVRGVSYQQSYCNSISLYELIIIIPSILFITNFYFFYPNHV